MTNKTIKAAFQSWQNGGLQTSALYLNENAVEFEKRHFESGTFATLHTFERVEEGIAAYEAIQEECL